MSVSFTAINDQDVRTVELPNGRVHRYAVPIAIAEINWANDNARRVFGVLGLDTEDLCGQMSIADARRACWAARRATP